MRKIYEFAVKTQPKKGEDILGYILRLGADNGRYKLSQITPIFGIPRFLKIMNTPDTKENYQFIEQLAASLKKAPSLFSNVFSSCEGYFPHYRSSSLKVCTQCCLSEPTKYIHAKWQSHHQTHCDIHRTRLISQCPCCNETFLDSGALLDGCNHCGLQWIDYCSLREKVPAHQEILSSLSTVEQDDYLVQLYQAYMLVSDPYKIRVPNFSRTTYIKDQTAERFFHAFTLISNKELRQEWLNNRLTYILADPNLSLLCQDQLKSLASNIIKKTPCYIEKLSYLKSDKALPYLYNDCFGRGLTCDTYSTPRSLAAKVIDLDFKSLNYLINSNRIESVYGEASTHINLCNVGKYLLKLVDNGEIKKYSGDTTHLISIEKLRKGLKYFNLDLSELLEILFKYDVEMLYVSPKVVASINKIHVNRDVIVGLLEQKFTEGLSKKMTSLKFKQITFLTLDQYRLLKKEVNVINKNLGYKKRKVTYPSVQDILKDYEIINRWAKIHSVKLFHVLEYLKHIPNLRRIKNLDLNKIFVYEKSPALRHALQKLLKQYKGELPKLAFLCL